MILSMCLCKSVVQEDYTKVPKYWAEDGASFTPHTDGLTLFFSLALLVSHSYEHTHKLRQLSPPLELLLPQQLWCAAESRSVFWLWGSEMSGRLGECGWLCGRCFSRINATVWSCSWYFWCRGWRRGPGQSQGRAAVVEVLAFFISSLYPVALILTSVYTHCHRLLLAPAIHLLASLNNVLAGVSDW